MQTTMFRPAALRMFAQPSPLRLASNHTFRRGFASQIPDNAEKADTSRSASTNTGGSAGSRGIFLIGGGLVFFVVAGRYFLVTDKPARSGSAERLESRRQGNASEEYRDPRDSGVKTLQQKKEKEQN